MTTAIAPGGPQWSPAQEDVFAEVESGKGHLVIIAGPGCAKTTTTVQAFARSSADRVLFAAFGKETAKELERKLPADIQVSTWHSFGYRCARRAMGQLDVDGRAPYLAATAELGQCAKGRKGQPARQFVVKLIEAAKGTLQHTVEELDALADTFGLEVPVDWPREALIGAATRVLERELRDGPAGGKITYADMPWLPIVHDLTIPEFDLVGVDELQDLNPCQLELAYRAAKGGRFIGVGDPNQSIFTWRGADPNAMSGTIERLSAHTLPLMICYRCGTDIVQQVNAVYPGLQSPAGQHPGKVRPANLEQLQSQAKAGDFVVSRLNAPLVSLCLRWMAEGRRCQILGRDFAKGLVSFIESHLQASSVAGMLQALDDYEGRELERLTELDRPTQALTDKCEAIRAVSEGLLHTSDVIERIERLFADDPQAGHITLASTHRAKGLEANRVWVLRDTYCVVWRGGKRGRRRPVHDPDACSTEERNLWYVALSRAKAELVIVKGRCM